MNGSILSNKRLFLCVLCVSSVSSVVKLQFDFLAAADGNFEAIALGICRDDVEVWAAKRYNLADVGDPVGRVDTARRSPLQITALSGRLNG